MLEQGVKYVQVKTPERRQCRRSGAFIVNFEHISTYFTPCSSISVVNFEHVTAGWAGGFSEIHYLATILEANRINQSNSYNKMQCKKHKRRYTHLHQWRFFKHCVV